MKEKLYILIGVVIAIIIIYKWFFYVALLEYDGRYTIGYLSDETYIHVSGRTSKLELVYHYMINGIQYSNNAPIPDNFLISPGSMYFVKYSKSHPNISEIDLNNKASIQVKDIPFNGWDSLPKWDVSQDWR